MPSSLLKYRVKLYLDKDYNSHKLRPLRPAPNGPGAGTVMFVLSRMHRVEAAEDRDTARSIAKAAFHGSLRHR